MSNKSDSSDDNDKRTPSDSNKEQGDQSHRRVTNEDNLFHVQLLGKRVDTLEQSSDRMKKWKKKAENKGKRREATPTRLDFESENVEPEKGDLELNIGTNDNEQERVEKRYVYKNMAEEDLENDRFQEQEPSPTRSVSVFDRMGKKMTNKDLRHRIDRNVERSPGRNSKERLRSEIHRIQERPYSEVRRSSRREPSRTEVHKSCR